MVAGPTLLQRTWDLLDSKMDVIMVKPRVGVDDTAPWMEARQQARGIAEVLAMFMVPHFSTPDEIAQEAVRRYKARQAGDTEYETAGLGTRRFEPPPGINKYMPTQDGESTAPAPKRRLGTRRKPAEKTLTQGEIESIKTARASGMFTDEQLASTFGVSLDRIKGIS